MATNQVLIDRALYKLGYLEKGAAADATDAADALDVLNDMMHEWAERDLDLYWFTQDTLGDEAPIPKWAVNAVIANLGVRLGSEFDFAVGPKLSEEAYFGKRTVGNTLINKRLDNIDMTHLPYGLGRTSRYDIETDT